MLKVGRTLVLFGINPGCGKLSIYFSSLKWTFHKLSRLLDKFSGALCFLSEWALVPLAGWNYQRNWQRIQLVPQSVCLCTHPPLRQVLCREHPGRTRVAPVCWVSHAVLTQDPLKAGAVGEKVPSVASGTHPENSRKPSPRPPPSFFHWSPQLFPVAFICLLIFSEYYSFLLFLFFSFTIFSCSLSPFMSILSTCCLVI